MYNSNSPESWSWMRSAKVNFWFRGYLFSTGMVNFSRSYAFWIFDHFIKKELGVLGYIRYVDDFVLFGENKAQLNQWKSDLTTYLSKLRLLPHPNKTQINQTKDGIPFLGFQVFPHYRYVRKEKIKRYRRYLKRNMRLRKQKKLAPQKLEDQLNAWLGHIRNGQSKRLEYTIFWYLRKSGVELHYSPSGSWRPPAEVFNTKAGILEQ